MCACELVFAVPYAVTLKKQEGSQCTPVQVRGHDQQPPVPLYASMVPFSAFVHSKREEVPTMKAFRQFGSQ